MVKYRVMPLVSASTSAVAVAVSAEVAVASPVRYLSSLPTCKVYTHTHRRRLLAGRALAAQST